MTKPDKFLSRDDEQRFLSQLTQLVRVTYGEDADIALAICRNYRDAEGDECVAVSSMGTVVDGVALMEVFALAIEGLMRTCKECRIVAVSREPAMKQ